MTSIDRDVKVVGAGNKLLRTAIWESIFSLCLCWNI